jgi:pimeloyl-ACP methyl ester carboxylesterase
MVETLWSYDPILFVGSSIGIAIAAAAMLRRRATLDSRLRNDVLIAAAFALPYMFVVGLYDLSLERFVMPLLPYAACLTVLAAAATSRAIAAKLRAASAMRAFAPATAGMMPALALVPVWHLGTVREAPDTFARAAECIARDAHANEDHVVVVPTLDLPLLHGETSLRENAKHPLRSNWVRYQMQIGPGERASPRYEIYVIPKSIPEAQRDLESDPMAYFREFDARFVVLGVEADTTQLMAKVRETVRANGELLCRLSPQKHDDGSTVAFLYRYLRSPWDLPFFRFVMRSQCMGDTLEVYRLR